MPAPFAPTSPTRPARNLQRQAIQSGHTGVALGQPVESEEGFHGPAIMPVRGRLWLRETCARDTKVSVSTSTRPRTSLSDVANSDIAKKAEDAVEDKAAEGGTLGSIADKADDAIDSVQGTKD